MYFYENFQRLCRERGKAETSVCRELDISPSAPKAWRSGVDPRPSTLKKLADYFDVDVLQFENPHDDSPIEEPDYIPVGSISAEEAGLLYMLSKLPDKQRKAIINLVKELAQ